MTDQRELLETQKTRCEERLHSLKAYVQELSEMAEKHGTDGALLEEDLSKAKSDIEFYSSQAETINKSLAEQIGHTAFQVYKDNAGEWRWRLHAKNSQIIATSGEGYEHRQDCLHGIELVKAAKDAPVEDEH